MKVIKYYMKRTENATKTVNSPKKLYECKIKDDTKFLKLKVFS